MTEDLFKDRHIPRQWTPGDWMRFLEVPAQLWSVCFCCFPEDGCFVATKKLLDLYIYKKKKKVGCASLSAASVLP